MSSGRRSRTQKDNKINKFLSPKFPERHKQKILRPNSRLEKKSIDKILEDEARIGEIEYTKVVIKALKEAINENDKLRTLVNQINDDNAQLKEDLDQRDKIIIELAEYYKFCQDNHIITQSPIKRKNYNSLKSLPQNNKQHKKLNKKK